MEMQHYEFGRALARLRAQHQARPTSFRDARDLSAWWTESRSTGGARPLPGVVLLIAALTVIVRPKAAYAVILALLFAVIYSFERAFYRGIDDSNGVTPSRSR